MAYTKNYSNWTSSCLLSGRAFNHLETQWEEITDAADVHVHTTYYTKTEADAVFPSASNYTGYDADLLDGLHYSDLIGSSIPIGGIVMWYGTTATVPSGYGICDGTVYGGYTSPDLRGRFIVGAGGTYAVGATGGSEDAFTPTGSITVSGHTLTVDEIPSHQHVYVDNTNSLCLLNDFVNASWYQNSDHRDTTTSQQDDGGGDPHGHPGSTITFDSIGRLPPSYALYFIMRYQ